MGRISSKQIKRTTRTLLKEQEGFSSKFEENKKTLKSYNLPDKHTRNKIAGYATRLKKAEKLKKSKK